MTKLNLQQHQDISVDTFKGLYMRGMTDATPLKYSTDCLNVDLSQNQISTRKGLLLDFDLSDVVRFTVYKRLNETNRYLILDSSGNLWDSLYNSPLITNAAFLDFSMVNYLNRAYISFHDRVTGLSDISLYVYQGAGPGTLRLAAGTPPSSFVLNVIDSTNSGNIEPGTHLFAVAFETDSGFITAPGPEVFAVYTAPGSFSAKITNLPIGPAGTVARWILATTVAPNYDGNQLGLELFFIPTGRVGDNTTTTVDNISFFDQDLSNSADYLFDLMSVIPSGVKVGTYANRLTLSTPNTNPHAILFSKQLNPESIDATSGFIITDPSDAKTGVTNFVEYRKSLYVTKRSRTYVTTDPGNSIEPSSWSLDSVDKAVGTECFGISTVLDANGANIDRFFVADRAGLYVFESGVYRKPTMSYNISDLWARINKNKFNLVQVAHDAENYIVYCAVPLDNSDVISHILVAYYENAISPLGFIVPGEVRWTPWTFSIEPSSITVDINDDGVSVLKIGSIDGGVHNQTRDSYQDNGNDYSSYYETYLASIQSGWIHHFAHLKARIKGNGDIDITLKGEDGENPTTISSAWTLNSAPGKELGYRINFINEKMSVRLVSNTFFTLFSLLISAKPKWAKRVE